MKYKTLIRRNSFLLSLLCAVVWLTGCVQDEFNTALPTSVDATRFALTVSDVNIPVRLFARYERNGDGQ